MVGVMTNQSLWHNDERSVARRLAEYVEAFRASKLPEATIRNAELALLDTLGCAIAAVGCEPARILESVIAGSNHVRESHVIGSGLQASALEAILVNGVLVRYLDCNDVYARVIGTGIAGAHPSDTIPMVLALSEREGTSGRDVLGAIVLAYELYCRLTDAEKVPLSARGWAIESKGTLLTPLVAGKLLGLSAGQLEQAVAISGSHGFVLGILDTDGEEFGMTKNIRFARVAQQGVVAALQAAAGFTGTRRVIEGHDGWRQVVAGGEFDTDAVFADRTDGRYAIDSPYVKLFCADGTQIGHLSAAMELVRRHNIRYDEIASVRVRCSTRCLKHCGGPEKRHPSNKESADHSIYFTTAALIVRRALGPAEYLPAALADSAIANLMDKVSAEADPALDEYGAAGGAEITLRSGESFRLQVDYPRGHPSNPIGEAEIISKFRSLTRGVVRPEIARRLELEVLRLESSPDLGELVALFACAG